MNLTNLKFLRRIKINAIVLYPFVLYCDAHPSEELMKHERVHLKQIKRDGVFYFYLRYLWEYFSARKRGLSHDMAYRNISYEKEAFAIDSARAT